MGKTIEERLCTSCNKVEDEIHFLCECVKYQSFRCSMFLSFGNSFSATMLNEEKFFNIMTSVEEKVVKSLGMFVASCNISQHDLWLKIYSFFFFFHFH